MIGEGGEQLGLMSLADAKEYAYSRDLDLVLMAANATPPVCKAMIYGKSFSRSLMCLNLSHFGSSFHILGCA